MKKLLLLTLIIDFCSTLFAQQYRLVMPKDDVVFAAAPTNVVNFEWSIVDSATEYILQTSTTEDFTLGNVSQPATPLTQLQLSFFASGVTYYWRIQASNAQGLMGWSYSRKFTIFDPNQLTGLVMWFDAAQQVTHTSNNISQWGDLSPSALSATQNTQANQPQLIPSSSVLCGRPVVHFNGNPSSPSRLNFSQVSVSEFTSLIVRNYSNLNNYMQYVIGGPSGGICAEADYYTGGYGHYRNASCGETMYLSVPGSQVSGYRIYTTQPGRTFRSSIQTPAARNSPCSNSTWPGLEFSSFGTRPDATNLPYGGDVAEVLTYNTTLDSISRTLAERYLRYKYAPPVNLGPDIISNQFCVNLNLNAGACFGSYLWSNGATTAGITVTTVGTYWVRVTDNLGYTSSDTINIRPQLSFNQLQDSISFCQGGSVVWNTGYPSTNFQFLWSTGESTPSITISNTGNYWVRIRDTLNCNLFSDTVFVFSDPFPGLSLGPTDTPLCGGNRLNFSYPDSQLLDILWSTGDTITEPIINNAGSYWVTATNLNGCVASDTINVSIKGIAPPVDFSTPILCATDSILFTNLTTPPGVPISSYFWDFGDGDTSVIEDPVHVFTTNGNYTVSLTAVTDSGCQNTISKNVLVSLKPVANFQAQISCALAPTQFTDYSTTVFPGIILTYQWHFSTLATDILQHPKFAFPAQGKYPVTLRVANDAGCIDEITDTVEAFAPFEADFSFKNLCVGDSTEFTDITQSLSLVSWFWNTGDNYFSDKKNFKHKFAAAGKYNVIMQIENAIGCVDSTSDTVTIYNHPRPAFDDMILCEGQPYTPLDSSLVYETANSWKWNIDGTIYNTKTPTHYFADTGAYNVKLTVTSANGCKDSTAGNVRVVPIPDAAFDFTPFYGDAPLTAQFYNQSVNASSYIWYFGDGGMDVVQDPLHVYTSNNTFLITLVAINDLGCSDSATRSITVVETDLDIAVTGVEAEEAPQTDGTVLITVRGQLSNVETRLITTMKLYATIGSGGVISEQWDTLMESGSSKYYTFQANFVVAASAANSYVCLEVKEVNNGETETRLDNNMQCTTIKGVLQVVGPSPNPARGVASLGLILPKAGTVTVEIIDVLGQIAMEELPLDLPVGRTDYALPVKMLRAGEYFVRVKYNDEKLLYKLLVN